MKLYDRHAKLIKEIMKRKEFYNGIHLKQLYKLISEHKQFDELYATTNKNDKNRYLDSTRKLLQHRAPGMKNFKNKHSDFYQVSYGVWTYFGNTTFKQNIEIQKDLENKLKFIEREDDLSKEEKTALVKVRINQSKFRDKLISEMKESGIGSPLRFVNNSELLIASHIIDYADCKNFWEKGNFNNGLILSPEIDKLFDRKYISFCDTTGKMLLSKTKKLNSDYFKKIFLSKICKIPLFYLTPMRREFLKRRNHIYEFS